MYSAQMPALLDMTVSLFQCGFNNDASYNSQSRILISCIKDPRGDLVYFSNLNSVSLLSCSDFQQAPADSTNIRVKSPVRTTLQEFCTFRIVTLLSRQIFRVCQNDSSLKLHTTPIFPIFIDNDQC